MTSAHAQLAQPDHMVVASPHLRLVASNAQGPDALKLRTAMKDATGKAFGGMSNEAKQAFSTVESVLAIYANMLQRSFVAEDWSYLHPPLKPVFSVKVTQQHLGKLKPPAFDVDD